MFEVKVNAEVLDPKTGEKFQGWVDPSLSMTTLFCDDDLEHDPIVSTFDTRDEAETFAAAISGSKVEASDVWTYTAIVS